MRRGTIILLVGLLVIGWSTAVPAHTINLSVKWSQLPELNAQNNPVFWRSEHPIVVVSNDWLCNSPDLVGAVRWWGTYIVPPGAVPPPPPLGNKQFELIIHPDIPAGMDPENGNYYNFSHPSGQGLWGGMVMAQEQFTAQVGIQTVYQYDAYLPLPFKQIPGTIYWLDIVYDTSNTSPNPLPPGFNWARWQAVNPPLLDITISMPPHIGNLGAPVIPPGDASFEIMAPLPGAGWLFSSVLLPIAFARRFRKLINQG
jgi:hypothetical protein